MHEGREPRNTAIYNRSSVTLDPPPFCAVFTISLSAATVAHHNMFVTLRDEIAICTHMHMVELCIYIYM